MSYYNSTEEQQFNEVKNWFKANGTPIVVAILVISVSAFGWRYWQDHQIKVAQETSTIYQNTMETYLADPAKNEAILGKFVAENSKTHYALFAQLEQAKQAVEKEDFSTANQILQQALKNTNDNTLQSVIRFRIATVQYQLQQYDDALTILNAIKDKAWEYRKQVLTGDILMAKGDKNAAKNAYEQARAGASEEQKILLDIRLNNL